MSCPCNGLAVGGPYSCHPCQLRKAGKLTTLPLATKTATLPASRTAAPPAPTPPLSPPLDVGDRAGWILNDPYVHQRLERCSPEDVATAIHEAAHATVAAVFGFPIDELTRHPDWDGDVRVRDGCLSFDWTRAGDGHGLTLRNFALIVLAGQIGEALVARPSGTRYSPDRVKGDNTTIDELCARCGFARSELEAETREVLATNFTAWDSLAKALLSSPTLTGRQVAAIVRTKDPTAHQYVF